MRAVYEESFEVRTWDSDSGGGMSPAALFNWCQEAAGKHAEMLGVGARAMDGRGVAWVLSRMSAEATRRPSWGERITVRTWPAGAERLIAVRRYELHDASGVFARAASAWLVLELTSKRPRRLEHFAEGLPRNDGLEGLEGGAVALAPIEGLEPLRPRLVAYSDLDRNGHANNARYAQWIQDALDPEPLVAAKAFRLDLNYLGEALPGALVEIDATRVEMDGWRTCFAMEGRIGIAPCFRARLGLR
jgi:acyl-CoA thioesterase FadM